MNFKLVLASESPRRKELLQRAGFFFHVFSVKVSENLEKNLTVDEQILTIARRKAEASLKSYKSSKEERFLILAADTMVILDDVPLGKPENAEQAFEFLSRLSGRCHFVKTAVVLVEGPVDVSTLPGTLPGDCLNLRFHETLETTQVNFRPLSEKEIREYIESGEPLDKAGAYGIQGFGGTFVEKYIGAFDNVVGLPMDATRRLLREGNWQLIQEP